MPDNENRSWNRFNSDFKLPESDDAARVAHEVKASVDTWIQNSLTQLVADMTQRTDANLAELDQSIEASKSRLADLKTQISTLRADVENLKPADPALSQAIAALLQKTKDAEAAMKEAAQKWEQQGRKVYDGVKTVAQSFAVLA